MANNVRSRATLLVAIAAGIGLAISGCAAGTPTDTPTDAVDPLGTPNPATGDPIVFGVLNLESGPVTFPEVVLAEQAAAEYVNEYLGGIGGRPIKIVSCATDGDPATSARCANQLLDENPVAILGGADTGAPGAIPVWEGADLAYLGGIAFTPVEQNSPNAAIFSSISTGDNSALAVYAAQELGVKSAVVIYTSDTQGTASAEGTIIPTFINAGVTEITRVTIPPTASDVSAAVATAVGANADAIYVDAPAACPAILNSLKQLGNTAILLGIDPCTSPPAIAGANGGADGLYFAAPVLDPFGGTDESNLYLAALAKYAPADIALDSLATIGFQTVINVQAALADFTAEDLTKDKILAAFTEGSDHPNFMGHPYTCDGNQIAGAVSVCNAFQQIRQVSGDKIKIVSEDWVTAGEFYVPAAPPAG